jgi:hypothetical protein
VAGAFSADDAPGVLRSNRVRSDVGSENGSGAGMPAEILNHESLGMHGGCSFFNDNPAQKRVG